MINGTFRNGKEAIPARDFLGLPDKDIEEIIKEVLL